MNDAYPSMQLSERSRWTFLGHPVYRSCKSPRKFRGSPRKRGRGAVPPVRIEKTRCVRCRSIDLAEMAAASRNWKPPGGRRWKAAAGNVRWPTDEQEKGDDMGGDTGEHRKEKRPLAAL